MAFLDNNNLVENIVNSQKQAMDAIVENTKKFTGSNNVVNETIEKGNEWYKNWLETQKSIFSKTTDQAAKTAETVKENVANATETAKENATKANDFLENWFKAQMNFASQMWEMNKDWAKNFTNTNATGANPFTHNAFTSNPFMQSNPFAKWQDAMNGNNNPWSAWMNQMQAHNWMNQVQQMNPFNQDTFKKATETTTNMFSQYYNMLNNTFSEMQKSMQNGTVQDAYKGMINIGEGFTKFAEMWEPMFKSIQDKTFNMDTYKQYMNPAAYKEMMDKFFSFMPGHGSEYMKNMTGMMNDGMKQMSEGAMNNYHAMRGMMNNANANMAPAFGNMLDGYNKWYSSMNEAAAPFAKMVTPNQYTKALNDWTDISNRIMVYNIKNAELQYMIYNQGQKVMDALAENIAKKVQEGKEVNSVIALYQEWLNISDKTFVSLFESDEYSKLMAEVGSLKMKLQKDIELQMEKSLANIPVATRSEMDEMYKTIYELKKQVREMERKMEQDAIDKANAAHAATTAAHAATTAAHAATTAATVVNTNNNATTNNIATQNHVAAEKTTTTTAKGGKKA